MSDSDSIHEITSCLAEFAASPPATDQRIMTFTSRYPKRVGEQWNTYVSAIRRLQMDYGQLMQKITHDIDRDPLALYEQARYGQSFAVLHNLFQSRYQQIALYSGLPFLSENGLDRMTQGARNLFAEVSQILRVPDAGMSTGIPLATDFVSMTRSGEVATIVDQAMQIISSALLNPSIDDQHFSSMLSKKNIRHILMKQDLHLMRPVLPGEYLAERIISAPKNKEKQELSDFVATIGASPRLTVHDMEDTIVRWIGTHDHDLHQASIRPA
jgi:hypothetical protein